jgi:hypothetical protein
MIVARLQLALRAFVLLALASFSLGQPAPPAFAHGVVDQVNEGRALGPGDVPSSSVNTIDEVERLGQEFTTSATSVIAVDLRLVPAVEPHASSFTVRIRQGPGQQCRIGESGLLECPVGFQGAILAQTTQDVAGVDGWVHFDFPSPAVVVPGEVYVISGQSNNYGYGWMRDEGNSYTGGMLVPGFPFSGTDFLFRTYAAPESPPETVTPTLTESPEPTPSPVEVPSTPTSSPTASPPAYSPNAPQADTARCAELSPSQSPAGTASPRGTKLPSSAAVPQASGPAASPSPTPLECEQGESRAGITAQASGLIALGVLTAGSVGALSVAAVRRRPS